ncbi:MAG: hypothetical protein CMP59_12565 [Flavobacteriales bacterium]|nr:hypothetical protein [Flavobacteriales bacterium]|tara:strand:+ start:367 stop:834 length:468 start_codon:yes stop_codon:yes gene_type:complete
MSFCTLSAFSQEEEKETEKESEGKHIVSIAIAHSQVNKGVIDGEKQWISLPSWEIAYNYRICEKFLIGLHGDFVTEQYVIEESEDKFIEREYPYSVILVGTYKLMNRLSLEAGFGIEFSPEEDLNFLKLGLEYAIPLANGFETILLIGYDNHIHT